MTLDLDRVWAKLACVTAHREHVGTAAPCPDCDQARLLAARFCRDEVPALLTRLAAVERERDEAVNEATGYSKYLSCCRDPKRHVEHQLDALASELDAALDAGGAG